MEWLLILGLGVLAGTVGGVVGFGSSILLLPVLAATLGAKTAVPVMAVAAFMANASRAAVWWREIDWKVVGVYSAAAVPFAALGARTLVALDAHAVEGALGAFLITSVPVRRWLLARGFTIGLPGLAVVGAVIGFLTGIVASTGPINTPFFIAYGLTKGAFLSTEALGSAAIGLTKSTVFQAMGVLTSETLLMGLLVGSALMLGSWLAKRIVQRMDASQFKILLEAMMLAAGAWMIWAAARGG